MARLARSTSGVRDDYAAFLRHLCSMPISSKPGCPWPAKLAALEAGETVGVCGWEVGWPRDFDRYWLHADGHLEPVGPGAP